MLGLFAYATFDLTSMAVFKKLASKINNIDLLGGQILTAGVAGTCGSNSYKVFKITKKKWLLNLLVSHFFYASIL